MKDYKETRMYKTGEKLALIGKVLMDEKATISDVVRAFDDAGYILQFRIVPEEIVDNVHECSEEGQ